MKKYSLAVHIQTAVAVIGLFAAASAYAATPTLTLTNNTSSAGIGITGATANVPATFYYNNSGSCAAGSPIQIGNTDASGSLTTSVAGAPTNPINTGATVCVFVNGVFSTSQSWPLSNPGPVLSTTSLTLNVGQSSVVTTAAGSSPVTIQNNSNPNVAATAGNGSQLTITGSQAGTTTLNICFTIAGGGCTSLLVTVQGASGTNGTSGTSGSISFDQPNPTVAIGQTVNVNLTGGSGYFLSNNMNSAVATAALNGNTVAITGHAAGSTIITVCSVANGCGTINASVGTAGTNAGGISFDQPNPTVGIGQTVNVNVTGGSGYTIASNSNSGVVAVTLNGNVVTILGGSSGGAIVQICSISNGCGTINVSVGASGTSSGSGGVTFGKNNPSLMVGQNISVSLSGGSGSYFISTGSGNAALASVNGTSLTLIGQSAGSMTITVCSTSGGCGTLPVTVTSAVATTVATVTPPPTPVITPAPAEISVANSSALLAQIQSLQSVVTQVLAQIQSIQSQLTQLAAQVTSGATAARNGGANTSSASHVTFTEFLTIGSHDAEVAALQERLIALGFYSGGATGYYGPLTAAAVKAYQASHGMNQTGYVGPTTRTFLNAGN